jgi:hypothetical protein
MLGGRTVRAVGTIGLALAIACGYPLLSDLVISVPASRVVSCKVTAVHRYTLHVTLDSGRTIQLAQENVPDPGQCLAPGTTVEKVRGEFGYRLNGRQYFWESEGNRVFAMIAFAGALAAAAALVIALRARRAQ